MQKNLLVTLIVLAGLLSTAPLLMAGDVVFRWVDKDGIVHYGDRAPDGVAATQVKVRPATIKPGRREQPDAPGSGAGNTTAAAAPEGGSPQLSRAEQSRQARSESRRKSAERARRTAANCATMRQQKAFVEPSPRVLVDDGNGGVRRLDDFEREDLLNEANRYLAENCTQ